MRIDKYLKISHIVKRRSVAQEMIAAGVVRLNGRPVKASSMVKVGDIVEVAFPRRTLKVSVICNDELLLKKGNRSYEVLEEHAVEHKDIP
ncbi:RNA-binding S4 domain-containing protein [Acetomicrobium hydrogeniformans]|uniref:RNA-binding S4 domain-containing protein n=1 Tax=Acetomicrobium hydrogeniformans TaxID=649746 RepID=A0A7V7BZ03_9BACT|nr:RNA-binding S4 domain-containing protein [Acetomicrobium hydrogeniformans]HHZ04692.1 RNA-binding S4 domain-containing protein [Acetomicrobium hydrogeniformans]